MTPKIVPVSPEASELGHHNFQVSAGSLYASYVGPFKYMMTQQAIKTGEGAHISWLLTGGRSQQIWHSVMWSKCLNCPIDQAGSA